MRGIALALLLGCAACAHTQVGVNSSSTASGAAVSSAGAQVNASGTLTALFLAGMLASAPVKERSAPEMRPDRVVQEQDCAKPIELSGNLRCR